MQSPVPLEKKNESLTLPAQVLTAAVGTLALGAGLIQYARTLPLQQLIELELAGTHGMAREATVDLASALWPYAGFITLAALTLCAASIVGSHTFVTHRATTAATFAAGAALFVAVLHLIETFVLGSDAAALEPARGSDIPFAWTTGIAAVKYTLLVPVAVIALAAIAAAIGRASAFLYRQAKHRGKPETKAGNVILPPPVETRSGLRPPNGKRSVEEVRPSQLARWDNTRRVPPGRNPAALGFCVSGGGIRSASVTLGALQALRKELLKARYLVSVSGGGYTVGALQLALRELKNGKDGEESIAKPEDVFEPGSAEEDHLRRHSRYIADGTKEWLIAAGVVLRGVLVSLTLIAATVIVVGLALSWAYRAVPLTDLSPVTGRAFVVSSEVHLGALEFRSPALVSILLLVAAAAVVWLLWLMLHALTGDSHSWALNTGSVLVLVALLLTSVVVVIPAVVWTSAWVVGENPVINNTQDAVRGGAAAGLLAYIGALVGLLWRHRKRVGSAATRLRNLLRPRGQDQSQLMQAVPTSATQIVIVWAVLLVLIAVALQLFAWTITKGNGWPWQLQVGIPLGLAIIALVLDQTWIGLHPFYRQRIASAFAVRRVRRVDGKVVARGYDFKHEDTPLHEYGALPEDVKFPQVIFAAAANLSGNDRTPPGRRAVSFTLSHDYIGGPDVGFAEVEFLHRRVSKHMKKDLTVQAAAAISGAAIASAMGRHARPYQTLFALSNARLGAWLPNPATVEDGLAYGWRAPCVPEVRRLSYLLREVFGVYPDDAPLLFVSDGGHYENLGLVELLRHGVKTAYCIDASGDSPPFAATLAEAITLAREELGIEITLNDPLHLVPGSAQPLEPQEPLSALNARLSRSAVVTGTITYPNKLEFDDGTVGDEGTLVVAKASLTRDMPYQLLAYAFSDPVFPRNSTSDQWFDHAQFDAYHALGQYLGTKAREALDERQRPLHRGVPRTSPQPSLRRTVKVGTVHRTLRRHPTDRGSVIGDGAQTDP